MEQKATRNDQILNIFLIKKIISLTVFYLWKEKNQNNYKQNLFIE